MGLEAEESDDPISIWPSSDDVERLEPCPPCPVEMPAVQSPEPSTNITSHATLSLMASESAVPLSEPLTSLRDAVTTPPAFTEFNRDTAFSVQPFMHMAEPSRSSKIENPDDKATIRIACDRLASSCVNCWCNGLEHHSHRLADCRLKPINLCNDSENLRKWLSTLRLPIGCCFYCGCPLKVYSPYANLFYGFPDVLLR